MSDCDRASGDGEMRMYRLSFLFGVGFLSAVFGFSAIGASTAATSTANPTTPIVTLPIVVRTLDTATGAPVPTVPTPTVPTPTVPTPTVTGTTTTGTAPTPFANTATVSLSSMRARARPVALKLVLGYEMQCGYPGPGPVVIDLPRQERVPGALTPSQVLVDGHSARSVEVSGHTISVGLASPPRIICMVIGMGRLSILLTRAAGLGNPAHAGSYELTATRATSRFSARFTILPA